MERFGLASHLKRFPRNEINKGVFTVKLNSLFKQTKELRWPKQNNELPVLAWYDFQTESQTRALIAIHGFIHDVSSFAVDHPGGRVLIERAIGTDATTAFFGGVYEHSSAAHNLLAMMRVGILDGDMGVKVRKRRNEPSTTPVSAFTPACFSQDPGVEAITFPARQQRHLGHTTPVGSRESHEKGTIVQSQAMSVDRRTLSVAPSDKLRIVETNPLPG